MAMEGGEWVSGGCAWGGSGNTENIERILDQLNGQCAQRWIMVGTGTAAVFPRVMETNSRSSPDCESLKALRSAKRFYFVPAGEQSEGGGRESDRTGLLNFQ